MKILYKSLLIIVLFTSQAYSQDAQKQKRDSLQNRLHAVNTEIILLEEQRETLKKKSKILKDSIDKKDAEAKLKVAALEGQREVLRAQIQVITDSLSVTESESLVKAIEQISNTETDSNSNPQSQDNTRAVGKPTAAPGPFRVRGRVVDHESIEPLVGATVIAKEINEGTIADHNGNYALILEKGYHTFEISFIGYEPMSLKVLVRGNGLLNIKLEEDLLQMDEVVIYSRRPDANIKGITLGKSSLSIETIESLPPFAGELDVLKSITLLPGVSAVGESSSGFNVRGGGSDQNLILLDKVTLYNPSHLFGFFSSFNSDVLSGVTVYKGGIPAMYGGRGSSIIDLSYKKGNPEKLQGKASIGTISTKLQLDGPIIPNKFTFLVGGRASYSNWLLKAVNDAEIGNSAASFYDVNALLNYELNDNNRFSYSLYNSFDDFKFVNDTTYSWRNIGNVLKWDHAFNETMTLNLSAVSSQYDFSIENNSGISNFDLTSKILDQSVNIDLLKDFRKYGSVAYGVQGKYLKIDPGKLSPIGSESNIIAKDLEAEQAFETGAYFQHEINLLNEKIGFSYGLRYSRFMYMGKKTVFDYQDYVPRTEESIISETTYDDFEVINTYDGFEPRVSLRYSFNESASIKAGFNKINQYIHLISNTASIAPTDIWKLSDPYLLPQRVTQYSLGLFKNFANNTIETSIEGYYKNQQNVIEYKDGAELILNDHLETELLNGRGQSYGVELYFRRTVGFVRGWVGYTYSRSLRQVIGSYPEELINGGDWFPSNFDKPHDLTATLEFQFSPNINFSSIMTYSTGRSISYPSAKFNYFGSDVAYFNLRNDQRAPDYMRIDVSWNFDFNSPRKIFDGKLTLSVFNLLGRKNAFSVFFDDVKNAPPQAYKLSVMGIPFPSASYSFNF